MKDDIFQKIQRNMIYFVYMYQCYKYDINLLPKETKDNLLSKNTLKGDISGITELDDIHPRKYGISV